MRATNGRPVIPYDKGMFLRLRRAISVIAIASFMHASISPVAGQDSPDIFATKAAAGAGKPHSVSPARTQAVTAVTATGPNDRSGQDDGNFHFSTFGFLVFDGDPADGDIPGFGPLQTSPAK